ncbi:unnamed protein product [Brugia timori]|uniref:Uncharacterized protein n=1 Tax=Brugia timori TaxID=42155 RepID=A0A0R3QQS1_9BILA|nr:unnamed protein product [Brugia timori]
MMRRNRKIGGGKAVMICEVKGRGIVALCFPFLHSQENKICQKKRKGKEKKERKIASYSLVLLFKYYRTDRLV